MAVLMVMGFSTQPWWMDLLDSILVSVITVFQWITYYYLREVEKFEKENQILPLAETERAYPSFRIRLSWLVAYLVLTVVLIFSIVIQSSYLPQKVHEHSEQLTEPAETNKDQ